MSTMGDRSRPFTTILRTLAILFLLGAIVNIASAREPVLISTCRYYLLKPQVGVLATDLNCTGSAYGVFLDNASLRMNGHAIDGATDAGIICKGSCKVTGPGSVSQSNVGIAAFPDTTRQRRVQIAAVDVHDNGVGINVSEPLPSNRLKIYLTDVTANDSSLDGVSCAAARVRGKNVTTNGNAVDGLRANAATVLRNFTSIGNSLGYDNLGDARSVLRDSTITGSTDGVDIATKVFPTLINTTCEHSLGPTLVPWGVCSGD